MTPQKRSSSFWHGVIQCSYAAAVTGATSCLGCTLFFTRLICALSIIRHCGHLDHTLHKETCHSAFRDRRIAVSILISVSSARWLGFSAAILPSAACSPFSPLFFIPCIFYSLLFSFDFSFRSSPSLFFLHYCFITFVRYV